MASPESSVATRRTLAPETSHRVILQLVSGEKAPLTETTIRHLNTNLANAEGRDRRSRISKLRGNFFLNIEEKAADPESALQMAVSELDEAVLSTLVSTPSATEVGKAWLAPADIPSLLSMTPDRWEEFEDVTPNAQRLFSEHHEAAIARALDLEMIYAADGAA